MKTIKQIKSEMRVIAAQMREMQENTVVEDRGFTSKEKVKWEKLLQRFDTEEKELQLLERTGVPAGDLAHAIPHLGSVMSGSSRSANSYASRFYDVKTGEAIRSWDRSTPIEAMQESLDPEQVEICRGLTFGHFLRAIQLGPRTEQEQRVLSIGTPSAGGFTVPQPLMVEFIDNLRNAAVVLAAGAVIVPMESKTLDIARLDTDPTPSWRDEGAAVTASDAVFSQVKLDAQDLSVEVVTSRELAQDSANLEAILMRSFIETFAIELDRVALVGSGTTPEPEGVLNATGVTEIDLAATTMTRYQSLVALRRDVQKANGKPTAWVMNHTTQSELAGLEDSTNQPLLAPAYYSDLETFATGGVPDNLGGGTDESPVFIGNWSDLLLGIRHDTSISVNPFLKAGTGQISWFVHLRADIQLARPASFGRIIGNIGVV
ncbi:MAG: phage major capsid protein [Proteobacteria bacterium]|nr:phage major capsid protein [Pseudomonadota bacterium]